MNVFDNVKCKLSRHVNKNIIVGGDFNCTPTSSDKTGGSVGFCRESRVEGNMSRVEGRG